MAGEYGFSSDDADDDEDEDKQHAHMVDGAGSTAQAHASSHSDALWWSRCRTLMMIRRDVDVSNQFEDPSADDWAHDRRSGHMSVEMAMMPEWEQCLK